MGRFISQDTYEGELNNPLTLNLYTYVENKPLRYIDPTGHRAWLIHGTFSDNSTWTGDFVNYVEDLFDEPSDYLEWTGENTKEARLDAAETFVKEVHKWHKENLNDPIRLVGHSHGGNVAIMLSNMLAEKGMRVETLITIATPVREYKLETEVGQHIQMYNNRDIVQMDMAGYDKGWKIFNLGVGPTVTRKFENAENVRAKDAEKKGNRIQAHSAMHSNLEVWKKYIEPLLQR